MIQIDFSCCKAVMSEQFRRHGAAHQTPKTKTALRAKAIFRYGQNRAHSARLQRPPKAHELTATPKRTAKKITQTSC